MSFVYLTDIPLFSVLSAEEIRLLQTSAARKSFPAQCIIQLEGEPAHAFVVLTQGQAKAVLFREDGREILLHFYGPGDFFGEMNLSELLNHPYTIISLERAECIVVPRTTMIVLLKNNGEFAFRLLSFVCQRLHRIQNKLRDHIYQRGEGRVLKYFVDIAEQIGMTQDDGTWIPVKLSHQLIADTCGLTRETVTRLVRQLHKDGMLRQNADGWWLAQQF